jgi:mRNA-degrading endonuclease RelE of RelBE toxin-antitoxin system
MAATRPYTLQIPKAIKGQLQRCRASIQRTIAERLRVIVESVVAPSVQADGRVGRKPRPEKGPLSRFYVLEGYRVSYLVNTVTRRVVVLELKSNSA